MNGPRIEGDSGEPRAPLRPSADPLHASSETGTPGKKAVKAMRISSQKGLLGINYLPELY